ncbi:Nramp family divalent metal transporter [Agaribacterium haliotis]|uniref:Nramp family divalent metal transporter n=1 Tax=Agaribacterium haliotis TaxID=2013869 RepID=UPI000BB54FC4|nr:Nramp family divalent metal transporter [Agaribacterium haliotis]
MDQYSLSSEYIQAPPATFKQRLKHLGPSLILTANVVGSGELIVTTTLGAKAGFILLWVVLISCVAKVAIQLQFGKYAILNSQTTLQSFNQLPGPRLKGRSWAVWSWLALKSFQMVQYGGIVGGVALVLHLVIPALPISVCAVLVGSLAAYMCYRGDYPFIEKFAITLVALFSIYTVYAVFSVQFTEFRISWPDIASGLEMHLPLASLGLAMAMFGITGVGADEIISYPYWCLEKGYARSVGKRDDSEAWKTRARGWLKVMYLDGVLSLCIYTLSTAAFYLLGAAVLHSQGLVPEGSALIATLSSVYTSVLGEYAHYIFLLGAFVTLFSTLFVAGVSATRMFADGFAQVGLFDYYNERSRERVIKFLAVFIPALWTALFLFFKAPVQMVVVGALALTLLLVIVVFAAICFKRSPAESIIPAGPLFNVMFWASVIALLLVGAHSLFKLWF